MSALPTLGRYLYAIPMLVFGSFHFMRGSDMAAAVAIMIGSYAVLATRLLALLLLTFAITIHLAGVINAPDEMAMQASMSNLLKDTALAGGALVLSGVFARAKGEAKPT